MTKKTLTVRPLDERTDAPALQKRGRGWAISDKRLDAIHDQAAPQAVLDGIARTLKPGGAFVMQDIRASSHLQNNLDHPIGTLLYTISTMHCMTVSLAQNGAGLGTVWGEELAVQMLNKAGFDDVEVHQLAHDFQNNFYVTHKPQPQNKPH